jgi:C4-dicarboxylate-specific signal transduction histidine kinase
VICFSSLNELPPEAARDLEVFRVHGPKSNLTFPLVANGQVFGALAFATLGEERAWRPDEIGELKLIAQIISNVVSRQRAEMREEQLRNELAHAMRVASLGELAAALAHELNQPLAAILSNAQAARRFIASGALDPDELNEILADIVRDDKRAGNVIHHLRAMVSKRPTEREACGLNELVREVLDLTRSEIIEAQIEVRADLTPELPWVQGARVELQQVLVNLLVNAMHAMKDTPRALRIIEVQSRAEADGVVVALRDRGHGVAPERLSVIFDPVVSTKASGLGMGLSICRRIIESHGGRLEARNHEDGGATFSFVLPIAAGTAK